MQSPVKLEILRNKYERLKIDCLEDVEPVDASSSWTITNSRREIITITNTILPDGSWVYGYNVYWANGKNSMVKPSAKRGKFRSIRDARLYAIGFLLIYLNHFLSDTQDAVREAEKLLLQTQLFD